MSHPRKPKGGWDEDVEPGLPWEPPFEETFREDRELQEEASPNMPIGFVEWNNMDDAPTSDGEERPNEADTKEAEALLADLRTKDTTYLLQEIHIHILADILAKLKTGIASHQELAIARNLLRDNGFTGLPDVGTMQKVEATGEAAERQAETKRRNALPNLTNPDYDEDFD